MGDRGKQECMGSYSLLTCTAKCLDTLHQFQGFHKNV